MNLKDAQNVLQGITVDLVLANSLNLLNVLLVTIACLEQKQPFSTLVKMDFLIMKLEECARSNAGPVPLVDIVQVVIRLVILSVRKAIIALVVLDLQVNVAKDFI